MSRVRIRLAIAALGVAAVALTGCAPGASEERSEGVEPVQLASAGAEAMSIKVFKSPTCGCCAKWIEHLVASGFDVDVEDSDDMAQIKAEAGVPVALQSCHTAVIGDYIFEGHVPIETIVRFMEEKPDVRGLAVPGMPVGSPGMEMGDRVDPYDVIAFDGVVTSVYESRR
jgi:hypothetical protein